MSAIVGTSFILSSILNAGLGRSRRSTANAASIINSPSTTGDERPARIDSTASSRRSINIRSGMAHHLRAQRLQTSPLKLFDRSLTSSDLISDLANALSFGEAHDDHALLIAGKTIHRAEERCALFDVYVLVVGHCLDGLRVLTR